MNIKLIRYLDRLKSQLNEREYLSEILYVQLANLNGEIDVIRINLLY